MKYLKSINESFKDNTKGFSLKQLMEHKSSYKDNVRDSLYDIVCDEERISEKDFKKLDTLSERLEIFYDEHEQQILYLISDFEKNKYRSEYCAEKLYAELWNI